MHDAHAGCEGDGELALLAHPTLAARPPITCDQVGTSGNQRVLTAPDAHTPSGDRWRVATDTETSMLPESFRKRHVRSKIR